MRDCVDQCASSLLAAVERPAASDDDELDWLLQLSADQSRCSMLSVTSDEPFVAYETYADDEYAVAVCTPLMKRVHRLVPQAADVVVTDSGPTVDRRRRCRVVVLAMSSSAGGLPLGVIAASSDANLPRAVRLYASLLDSRCFYGRGPRGPTLLLVDDCPVVRAALSEVFTASSCLLCTYRLLVSYWRQLWDRKSAVGTEHRARCFTLFRAAVCADSVDELHANFADVQGDFAMMSCASLQSHLLAVYERRAEWSVCCQKPDWPAITCVRDVGANRGLCGYASRTLKDAVLDYIKSMKTLRTLLAFVGGRCDRYYERRLTETVAGRLDEASAVRFMHSCDVDADVLNTVPPSQFAVTLRSSAAALPAPPGHVELSVGLCSCSAGCAGGPCLHQWAAVLHTRASSWMLRPVSSTAAQRVLAHIATGRGYADASWFASSHPLQSSAVDVTLMDDSDVMVSADRDRLIDVDDTVQVLASATQSAAVDSLPAPTDSADDNKHIVINWNGLAYEVSLQEQEAVIMESTDALNTPSTTLAAPTRPRLRQALDKIETAYLNHAHVMETAVNAFCQTVESIEVVEHMNSALLSFGNSFLTSGSAALSWS